MTADDVAHHVRLIFGQAEAAPELPYRVRTQPRERVSLTPYLAARPRPPFVWTGPKPTLLLEQVGVLRALYGHCTADQTREAFRGTLLRPLGYKWKDHDQRIADTVAHILIEIGAFDLLVKVEFDNGALG